MFQKLLRIFPVIFLFSIIIFYQNGAAQTDEQIIKQYQGGQLSFPTQHAKEIIARYLDKINGPSLPGVIRSDNPPVTAFTEDFTGPFTIFDENFNYATGDLITVSGGYWTHFSGTGSPIQVTGGSLIYTGYPLSDLYNKINIISISTSAEDVYKEFTANGEGKTTYAAFLVNVTNTTGLALNTSLNGDYFMAYLPNNSTTNFAARLGIRLGTVANTFQIGIRSTGLVTDTTGWYATNLDVGTTYLFIMSYSAVPGAANDVVSLWINPPVDGSQPAPNITKMSSGDAPNIARIVVRQGTTTTPNAAIDGIRVGLSWAEIFPSGTTPPVGWTNVSNIGNNSIWEFNNPGLRSITGSNFDGNFVILDSDHYGSGNTQDATITTKVIDASALTTVILGFDEQFRALTGSYGIVQVSNDGTNWTRLDSITTNAGYPTAIYKEYDATSVAAGHSTVYFRWKYYGSWAWWWAIDNVIVYQPAPEPLPAVLVSPPNGGTGIDLGQTLNWLAGGGNPPTGYRIYFGTDGGGVTPPINIENNTDLGLVTTYTPASLNYGTTYYWEIIPYNVAGDATGNVIWSFTTQPDPTVYTYPFFEGFEADNIDGTPINGWTQETISGYSYWTANNTQTSYNRTPRTGAWNAYLLWGNEHWMFKPFYFTAGTTYTLEFYARQDMSDPSYANMTAAYGDTPNSASMVNTIISTTGIINGDYQRLVGTITPSATGRYYIGIKGFMNGIPYYISIDDISVSEAVLGTLNGTVTNCFTTNALEGATVTTGSYTTTTSATGYYEFLNMPAGTYDVTASKLGYISQTIPGVVITTGTTTQNFCLNEVLMPPENLQAAVVNQDVNLTWQAHLGDPDYVIRWDDGVNYDAIGVGGAVIFDVASRWAVEDIAPYNGKYLQKIAFFPREASATYTIKVWKGDNAGTLLYSQVVNSPIMYAWNEVRLSTPIQIDGTQELWFGYEVNTPAGYPAGCDAGPQVAGKGNMILWDGAWYELTALNPDLIFNWNLAGYVYNTASDKTEQGVKLVSNLPDQMPKMNVSKKSLTSLRTVKPNSANLFKGNRQLYIGKSINATLTGYNVYRDNVEIIHNTPNLFYNDLSLPYGVYSYTVAAQYEEGESQQIGPVTAEVINPNLVTDTILVYPQSASFWTGTTDGLTKTDGEINTVNPNVGWAVFDISTLPADATVIGVKFNGYVNAANWPYWAATPMGTVNPVTDDALTISNQISNNWDISLAYIFFTSSITTGWYSSDLVTTAIPDLQNAINQGWFAMGFIDFDFSSSWYVNFDGWSQPNPPYLQIIYRHMPTNTFPLSVDISNGWNMVSVPGINPDGQTISNWWINHTGTVYKFVPGSGYSGITNTIPGEGYWMKNNTTQTYNTGDEWPAGGIQFVTHDPVNAVLGWNMFGGYEDAVNTSTLTTNPPDKIVSIYKFVPGTGYQVATQLVPGYGYWIKVSAACTISIPDVLAKSNPKVAEFFKDDWGRITLTDAAGSTYTLYAVKGDVDLNQYELPPLPPSGIFDVRFGSSRVAEDINSGFQSIEMRGITYPVRVKVEGMDIRLMDVTGKVVNANIKDGEEITIDNSSIEKVMVSGQLIPDKYSLEQNYPNPFNPSTTIEFSLPENVKNVTISVYNILGQKVSELVNGEMLAGRYHYQWNAKNFASGIYIYELRTEKFVSIKKMMLLK